MATFLDLVNGVLRELREPEVSTWTESDYSKLIGQWVNAAKRDVENAWDWSALRESLSVTTSAGTTRYTLTGAKSRFKVLGTQGAYNSTAKWPLRQLTRNGHRGLVNGDFGSTTGLPTGNVWAYSWVEGLSGGSRQIDVWPVPTGAETLRFFGYNPPEDFTADGDTLLIPARPIIDTALARARAERGEDGGISVGEQAVFAMRAAQDEIARDANRYDEELVWGAV